MTQTDRSFGAENVSLPPELEAHAQVLRDRVFEATRYLPQFELLLEDLAELRAEVRSDQVVVSLERMILYGKNLFSPYFSHCRYVSLDSSPTSADERGAYNARLVDDPRFVEVPCESRRCPPEKLEFDTATADFVLIPNLVHHVRDQSGLWREAARVLKPGGTLYVFEPTLRELHQIPDDYLRYTPSGMQVAIERFGLQTSRVKTTGGPFTAIAYCWNQALQYIEPEERAKWETWFSGHFEELVELEVRYPTNQVRKFTSFPTAFSLRAVKA